MLRLAERRGVSEYLAQHLTPVEVLLMKRLAPLQSRRWPNLFFRLMSRLGDWPLWAASGLLLLAVGGERERAAVAVAGAAAALTVSLFTSVKNLIGRPRPYERSQELPCLMAPPDKFSFPSGHTMTAFAFYAVYAGLLPGIGWFFLPMALCIGFSRVYLGCHYPTDVVMGALLGCGAGKLTVWSASILGLVQV